MLLSVRLVLSPPVIHTLEFIFVLLIKAVVGDLSGLPQVTIQGFEITGIDIAKCSVFSSNAAPLRVVFKNAGLFLFHVSVAFSFLLFQRIKAPRLSYICYHHFTQ